MKQQEIQKMNEIFKDVIDRKVYAYTRTTFFTVKTCESWRGRVDLSRKSYKEEKEALNAMVFFILLIEKKVNENIDINFNACIAFVIIRLIRKALTWDSKPENKRYFKSNSQSFEKSIEEHVYSEVVKNTSKEFADSLYGLAAQISDYEKAIYLVAKHYTNWVEFKYLTPTIFRADINRIDKELKQELSNHNVSSFINEKLSKLISRLSWARNIIRWQGCGPELNCNVLCHMFETAIFGWYMAIELNVKFGTQISPQQAFLVGLYHDVSEIWTDDIPSNCKDIELEPDKKLRPLTEEQEREALRDYFYPSLSEKAAAYFKENIMLEDLEDKAFHKFIKNADYFSADCEVYWMIVQGSKNRLFIDIMKRSLKSKVRTPEINKLLRKMIFDSIFNPFMTP